MGDRSGHFRRLAQRSLLHDAAAPTGALWLSRRLIREAENRVRNQDRFKAWTARKKAGVPVGGEDPGARGMQSAFFQLLLGETDSELLRALEQEGTPLAKITGHTN